MRILDENGNEILNPDYSLGYVLPETILVAHHDEQPEITEQFHYEVVAEYPSGGKDVVKIIDVPGQKYHPAWDEYEDILRWHWFGPQAKTGIAIKNINKGEYFAADKDIYLATENIPKGIKIAPNVNCIETSVEEALNQQEANNGKTDL